MELIFLGSGSAFTVGDNNYNSNLLLRHRCKNLLIDCGSDIRHALSDQNLSFKDITDVYISHLHADHAGGLEWLGFNWYFNTENHHFKPVIYISELLYDDFCKHLLTGGLSTLQNKKIDIKTYFNVHKISLNHSFKWQHIEFHLIQVLHTMSGYKITPCFGLYFTIKGIKILFTADIQFYPNLMMSFYEDADIIFHDCQTKHTDYSAHAQYDELKTLPLHIKNKIWLYHYNPDHTQNSEQDGFRGFVKKGQVFKF